MLLQSLGHLKGLLYDEGVIIDDPVRLDSLLYAVNINKIWVNKLACL